MTTTTCVCCPVRELFLVYVDLDPVPGAFSTPLSASETLKEMLEFHISHYNPTVILVSGDLCSRETYPGNRRVCFAVLANLDPIPGTFHTKESARDSIAWVLHGRIGHYNPIVSIARNNTPSNETEGNK